MLRTVPVGELSVLSRDFESAALIALGVGAGQRTRKPRQVFELSVEDHPVRTSLAFNVHGPIIWIEFRFRDGNRFWSRIDRTGDGLAVPIHRNDEPVLRGRIWPPLTEERPFCRMTVTELRAGIPGSRGTLGRLDIEILIAVVGLADVFLNGIICTPCKIKRDGPGPCIGSGVIERGFDVKIV